MCWLLGSSVSFLEIFGGIFTDYRLSCLQGYAERSVLRTSAGTYARFLTGISPIYR